MCEEKCLVSSRNTEARLTGAEGGGGFYRQADLRMRRTVSDGLGVLRMRSMLPRWSMRRLGI